MFEVRWNKGQTSQGLPQITPDTLAWISTALKDLLGWKESAMAEARLPEPQLEVQEERVKVTLFWECR